MLREIFFQLTANYTRDNEKVSECWNEIELAYLNSGRHYHNLEHLAHLFTQLTPVKDSIKHWDAILFALFYHDIVYNTLLSNNEAKSAKHAEKRMKEMNVPGELVKLCGEYILATKTHPQTSDEDINFFTDADLSVLGASADKYLLYSKQIRKEYSLYPDRLYVHGRKKVLEHFLFMKRIYKTDFFFDQYELQARRNLQEELNLHNTQS